MAEQPAGVGTAVGDGLSAERPADVPVPGAVAPGGELVPRWLVNLAELGWRVLAVSGLLVVIWFAVTLMWTVTASIAVAVVVSAVFAPLVLRLRAQGRSRTAAAGIVWPTAILTVGGILLVSCSRSCPTWPIWSAPRDGSGHAAGTPGRAVHPRLHMTDQ